MKLSKFRLAGSLFIVLLLAARGLLAQPAQADPDNVKTAYLLNFLRYTNWPVSGASGPSQPLNVCVLDAAVLGGRIGALQGRGVGSRIIEVKSLSEISAVRQCQLVFVAAAQARRLPEVVRQIKGHAVLLVSDVPDAGRSGAAIELLEAEDRIRMIVNRQNAEQAGITFSAQLLKLALAVY